MFTQNSDIALSSLVITKFKAYFQLLKLRLSLLVAFSAGVGYWLAPRNGEINWVNCILFLVAGIMVTGASNTLNQIIERYSDRLMKRTMNRPLPTGVLSVFEASVFAGVLAIGGIYIMLQYFTFHAALMSFVSMLLYAFAYTPMKTRHPIAVFIGAIPGALPPMIGWLAVTNQYGLEPGILFAIQFVWQFPHFWAIAWVLDEDYQKAGIKLLPGNGAQDLRTAFNIMIYTLMLIPLGFVPYFLGMTGITSAIVALICGVLFLIQTLYLMRECSRKAALMIMFGSFIYLPIVQIAFVLDKIVVN
jgi:protoheme IX farnesyltransferase